MANWIVKPSTFEGKPEEDVEEWCERMDSLGAVNTWNNTWILQIVLTQLTGAALRWYKSKNATTSFTHWTTIGQGNVRLRPALIQKFNGTRKVS